MALERFSARPRTLIARLQHVRDLWWVVHRLQVVGQMMAAGSVPPPQQAVLIQGQVRDTFPPNLRKLPQNIPSIFLLLYLFVGASDSEHVGRCPTAGAEADAGRASLPAHPEDVPRPGR